MKYKAADAQGRDLKATKNHAAGSNERQDAYLYGHPLGRRKRYRSPAEFFPHLLWLCTDESGDVDNCSCKLCCPEEIEAPTKVPTKIPAKAPAKEAPRLKTAAEAIEASKQAAKAATQAKAARAAAAVTPKSVIPVSMQPTALPRFKSIEQKLDAQPNKFVYRTGEIVWFARSTAWGLGVVIKREANQILYRVQPLSHPFGHPQLLSCEQSQLRPWLAWSPPPCTCEQLNPSAANGNRVFTFDLVDWSSMLQGRYGSGDPEVDGSILAAKAVEMTFTPFDTSATLSMETHYNGIYIGAEKIWVGDALRLRHGNFPTDIMVLHDIIEYPNKLDTQRPRMVFVGDTYCYRIAQLEPQAVPADDLHLPSRVREDVQFRNKITSTNPEPNRRFTSFWRLNRKSDRIGIADIKGRWYESSALLPILDPQGFAKSRANGDVQDAGLFMNGQGDCNKPPTGTPGAQRGKDGSSQSRPADLKFLKREEAFGKAVPSSMRISRGLDEPKRPDSSGGAVGPSPKSPAKSGANALLKDTNKPQGQSSRSPDSAYPPHLASFDQMPQQYARERENPQQYQAGAQNYREQVNIEDGSFGTQRQQGFYQQQSQQPIYTGTDHNYDAWTKNEDTEMSGQDHAYEYPGFEQDYETQQMNDSLFGEHPDKMEH